MCPALLELPVEAWSPTLFHLMPSPSSGTANWSVAGKLDKLAWLDLLGVLDELIWLDLDRAASIRLHAHVHRQYNVHVHVYVHSSWYMKILKNHNSLSCQQPRYMYVFNNRDVFWPTPGFTNCAGAIKSVGVTCTCVYVYICWCVQSCC